MPAPLVALTATTKLMDGLMRVRLNEAYVDAARAAGLAPLVLPPLQPDELAPVLDVVSGVILTGGEDVDPAEYAAPSGTSTHDTHRPRDRCELALTKLARARGLPTLAICRGIQVVNVALGGTLVQDIPQSIRSAIDHDRSEGRRQRLHEIQIEPDSKLARALGATTISVNSSHHQALDRVAPGLRVTARSSDGVIEGAEWAGDDWWMLGVQWHPEELTLDAEAWDRELFSAFAAQAARVAELAKAATQPVRRHRASSDT
jgi:putative glutamine amidotransferase